MGASEHQHTNDSRAITGHRRRHQEQDMKLGELFVLLWSVCFLLVIFLAPFVLLGIIFNYLFL